jgi:hypothetical protein
MAEPTFLKHNFYKKNLLLTVIRGHSKFSTSKLG